jgi:hypothetical protein
MNTPNISELVKKIEIMIAAVRDGAPSQYFNFRINEDTDDEEMVTIRVADHQANPARVSGKTIFFIVETNEEKKYKGKKAFVGIPGRIYLNDENCNESGYDIEYLLDYELN